MRVCRRFAVDAARPARCLTQLPRGTKVELEIGAKDFERRRDAFMIGLQMGFRKPPARVFHVLFGGVRGTLPDEPGQDGRWPPDQRARNVVLSLVGMQRPRVLGRTTVRGAGALLLAWSPIGFSGSVHGGHQGILWRAHGATWVVSMHFLQGTPEAERLSLLRRTAASLQTV